MAVLKNKCIYSYYSTLLDTWVEWNSKLLMGDFPDDAETLNEALGEPTSDCRSRAKEMFRIGLVSTELTQGNAALRQIRSDKNVQSSLGFIAAVIHKASNLYGKERFAKAESALCAIFSVIQSVSWGGFETSINSIAHRLLDVFPCPEDINLTTWLRYLLSGLFCPIASARNAEDVTEYTDFFERRSNNITLSIITDQSYTTICTMKNVQDVRKAITDRVSLTGIVQQKMALFILGTDRDVIPRGFLSLAFLNYPDFLKYCYEVERAYWHDNPFSSLYDEETELSGKYHVLEKIEQISGLNSNLAEEYNKIMKDIYQGAKDALNLLKRSGDVANESSLQKIFYGAPGTGKSHEVKRQTGEWLNEDEDQDLPNVFRTTFHPDTDYASFVGCYKPTMRKTGKKHQVDGKDVDDEEIIYEYVPQVFADAYVYAYNNPGTPTYLVIEEINRGNCAQIFGDLFQLLDRKNGKSEYKIKADKDLAKYLCEAKDKDGQDVLKDKDGIKDGKLCLPANLHILATMNTSDQSLFPMDSAFKRRWDWEYIPIKYSNSNWRIDIAGYKYSWIDFQTEINKRIFGATESEDKQLGDFFVKADDNNIISSKLLLNKVIFYLWNDVCKDGDGDIFKVNTDLDYSKELDPAKNEDITFSKFFKETDLKLKQWMRYLNIKPLESQDDDDEEKEDEAHQQEEGVKPNEAKPDTYSKPEYKSIIENMLPQLSNEDISIFENGFDWSFSDMPGSYARMSLALDAPAKNKKANVKVWVPGPTGYSKSAECFAYLKAHGGEDIIRTTASKYGYEYEELGIRSKNPNPVVGWKITIPMTFAPDNSQAESQKLLDILSEVRTAFDPIISDFLKK